jgi:hypothetical protein
MCCMDDGVWLQEKNMSNPTNDITLILDSNTNINSDYYRTLFIQS